MIWFSTLTQDALDQEFNAFCIGDSDTADSITRLLVVASVSFALFVATDDPAMLVFGAGYTVLNIILVAYLRSVRPPVSPSALLLAAIGSCIVALWYCGLVIYIAASTDGAFLLLALCGAVGAALHSISRNAEFSLSSYIDFAAAMVSGAGVMTIAAVLAESFWMSVSTLLGGLFVAMYFWLGFRQVISEREALRQKILADVQDQKMQALGQLTSGVAHDFNNLLSIMLVNIELSEENTVDETVRQYLGDARFAAESGAHLVEQLMAFVRKADLNKEEVRLVDVFEPLEALLQRVLPDSITLTMHLKDPECRLEVDSAMLENAVLNLVMNARDAIGEAGGKIAITAETDRVDCQVRLVVADDGPGMDQETLHRAREPFFTTKGVGEGSGLGLSMANGFAEQSGGELTLTNGDAGGLVAAITLPLAGFGDAAQRTAVPAT
ncbi:MAG: ATP-binding protein [Pseudomonadota bacterium]